MPPLYMPTLRAFRQGNGQCLAVIRSMVREPAVLLDEPTASLDSALTLAMESMLLDRLESGLGLVMVTHSREQAAHMSHRHFEMRDGRLHALCTPSTFMRQMWHSPCCWCWCWCWYASSSTPRFRAPG